jgi:hypothetical protein
VTDFFSFRVRFLDLLIRYILRICIRGNRVTGLAPCHDDRSPSFSADLDKIVNETVAEVLRK